MAISNFIQQQRLSLTQTTRSDLQASKILLFVL